MDTAKLRDINVKQMMKESLNELMFSADLHEFFEQAIDETNQLSEYCWSDEGIDDTDAFDILLKRCIELGKMAKCIKKGNKRLGFN